MPLPDALLVLNALQRKENPIIEKEILLIRKFWRQGEHSFKESASALKEKMCSTNEHHVLALKSLQREEHTFDENPISKNAEPRRRYTFDENELSPLLNAWQKREHVCSADANLLVRNVSKQKGHTTDESALLH